MTVPTIGKIFKYLILSICFLGFLYFTFRVASDLQGLESPEYREPTLEEIQAQKKVSSTRLELLKKGSPGTYSFFQRYDSAATHPDFRDKTFNIYGKIDKKTAVTTDSEE